ncbi:hypothetical protein [Salinispora vitiensis]|nr:hypothetical protein [Salinispora vitiensis]
MAKKTCWCGKPVAWEGAALCTTHDQMLVGGLTGIRDMVQKKTKKN